MLKFISTCNIKVIYEFMTAALNLKASIMTSAGGQMTRPQ